MKSRHCKIQAYHTSTLKTFPWYFILLDFDFSRTLSLFNFLRSSALIDGMLLPSAISIWAASPIRQIFCPGRGMFGNLEMRILRTVRLLQPPQFFKTLGKVRKDSLLNALFYQINDMVKGLLTWRYRWIAYLSVDRSSSKWFEAR